MESKLCDYVMVEADSNLKLLPTSILPYWTYTICLSTLICCPYAYGISLTQVYPLYLAQILGFWVTCGSKSCDYVMVEADSHLKLLPTSILDIYKVFGHIDMLSIGIW